jgi:hypothetical protein
MQRNVAGRIKMVSKVVEGILSLAVNPYHLLITLTVDVLQTDIIAETNHKWRNESVGDRNSRQLLSSL